MNIIVSGGAGYIGSVVTQSLLEEGHRVTVIDNLSHGNRDAVPTAAVFIEGNIADLETLVPADQTYGAVVHLAAFIAAGESMTYPEKYWQNNTLNTISLLNAMRAMRIPKLVFASTAAVYGNPTKIPLTEESPVYPTNTYGMTKLSIDMAITSEVWAHQLAAVSLRFFNVAGAYKQCGERHPVETHIIPLLLGVADDKRKGFTIFGDDYETPDGTCIRDYIHVYDLARAVIVSLESVKPGEHRIYNLANGKGFSNKQVIDVVKKVTGKDFAVTIGERREGDPAQLIASSEKATKELGWIPSRPDLEDMIRDAWEFYLTQR